MLFIEKGMLRQFYYKYDKDLTEHIGYENGMIICRKVDNIKFAYKGEVILGLTASYGTLTS